MLTIATIGTNVIVDSFLSAVEANGKIQCIAMYTRKKEHALALAQKFHIPSIYTDLDEMLDDPTIDIVYIASPNSLHYVYAKQILAKGKHVICEKPFTSNVKQCEELFALAEKNNRFIFEAIKTIHMPNFKKIQKLLPSLGDIKLVHSNFSRYSKHYDAYVQGNIPNCLNPSYSGGALADIGIYSLHLIIGLFGTPDNAQYFPNIGPNGADISGMAILQYKDMIASFACAKDSNGTLLSEIQGTKGTISIHSQPSKIIRFTFQDRMTMKEEDLSVQQHEVSLYEELDDFIKIISEKDIEQYRRLKQETITVMRVYEDIRKSAGIQYGDDETAAFHPIHKDEGKV